MKYLAAALAACCAVLIGAVVYTSLPDAKSAPTHTAAYQRIDTFLAALKKHDYKTACDVLAWYSANQWVTDAQCVAILKYQFDGKMDYRLIGDTVGRAGHYVVVTAVMVQADQATKVDEVAVCQQKWAAGEDCVWAGVYTFGVQLVASPKDTFSGEKKPTLHWYVAWIH